MFKTKIMSALDNALNGGVLYDKINRCLVLNDFFRRSHRYLQSVMFKFVTDYICLNARHYQDNPQAWFDGRNIHVGKYCSDIVKNNPDLFFLNLYEKESVDEIPYNAKDVDVKLDESHLKEWLH